MTTSLEAISGKQRGYSAQVDRLNEKLSYQRPPGCNKFLRTEALGEYLDNWDEYWDNLLRPVARKIGMGINPSLDQYIL